MEVFMPSRRRLAAAIALLALASSLAAPRADATITPDAQKVIDRYLAATGGREAVLAERSSHSIATLNAFGLKGRIESWTVRPDRAANVTNIGPFVVRAGYDRGTGWRVDQNGKFLRLDGKDLEEAHGSNWFDNDLWLAADQGGGDVKVKGAEKDSAGSYTVLTLTAPTGRPRDVWFDSKTGLLVRTVSRNDQQTVITRIGDYRQAAGRLRSHLTHVSVVGMPANDLRATLDSIWVDVPIDDRVFAPPAEKLGDTRYLKSPGVARLPFRYDDKHVWLTASLNGGPPEDFLLDTGASVTVIDSASAARYGMKLEGLMQAQGAGAAGGASFSQVDSLRVAGPDGDGVTLIGQKVAVLSVNPHLEPFFWKPIVGILGYDFISRFVVEIDFASQTLVLHDPKTFTYQGKGQAVPLTMAGNIPVVKAKIDDTFEGEFRLDVGSGSTVDIHTPFARENKMKERMAKTLVVTGGGFGGTFQSTIGRMKKMEIGPFSWTDPLISLSGAETGGLASEDYAGNIGNQILDRFKCTFDYERRVVYLEPSARYGERDRFTMAGVSVVKHAGEYSVAQVLPGSAAEAAGLKAGDRVVALDGKPIASYGAGDLGRMFESAKPGDKHVVEVRRDGKGKKLSLKLKEII
jgi:hypothetical protein